MSTANAYLRANKMLFVTLLLVLGMGVANAAFPAPNNPPNNNTLQPLNVGGTAQFRTGDLGVGTAANPPAGAAFEIGGTSKGFLPPRLTTAQRNSLTSGLSAAQKTAVKGLVVYNTSSLGLETWDGTAWQSTATSTGSGGGAGGTIEFGPALRYSLTSNLALSSTAQKLGFSQQDFFSAPTVASFNAGTFSSTIAGQYLVTVHLEVSECGASSAYCLTETSSAQNRDVVFEIKKGGTTEKTVSLPLDMDSGRVQTLFNTSTFYNKYDYPKTVEFTHLVSLAAGQSLEVWASGTVSMNAIGNPQESYISIARVGGSPIVVNPTQYVPTNVEAGAIVYYDSACPSGWTEYTALQGRYAVGVPSGGSVGTAVGTALSNGENRPAGAHFHYYDDHYVQAGFRNVDGAPSTGIYEVAPLTASTFSTYNGNNPADSSALKAGTPAPYVQLRACRKN